MLRPSVGELRGRLIRLRPFAPDGVDAVWQCLGVQDEPAHPRPRPEDHRPVASERFRQRIQRSGQLWRGCLDLVVEREGRLVGLIQARTSARQTLPLGAFEIGVGLFRRQDHGTGYGREAVALLTTWLFDQAGAERVQASTEIGNAAMRTVLERLGFRLEGIMRGYGSLRDGSRTDAAMYAVVRPEWTAPRG